MPSFDVVSEVDMQEVRNAVDQANREISNRYDFKGSDSRVELGDSRLVIFADDEYKIGQAREILHTKLAKRKVDLGCLKAGEVAEAAAGKARQELIIQQGIDAGQAKKLVKMIKDAKLKVQASIQGETVRVSGKKRDDLQAVIGMLGKAKTGQPLQYVNFRD